MVNQSIELNLELDSSTVSVGQSLSGIIHLRFHKEPLPDPLSFQLELVGEESVYQYSSNLSDTNCTTQLFWNYRMLEDDDCDNGTLSSMPVKFATGIHYHLPFALSATPTPPRPSWDCYQKSKSRNLHKRSCHVRYYLNVFVPHGSVTTSSRQPVTIVPPYQRGGTGVVREERPQVPLQHISSYELGSHSTASSSYPSSSSSGIMLGVRLANTYMCPGETLQVGLAVQNRSSTKRVKRVEMQLYQDVEWHHPTKRKEDANDNGENNDSPSKDKSTTATVKPAKVSTKLWESKDIAMPEHWVMLSPEKSEDTTLSPPAAPSANETIMDQLKKCCETNMISIPIPANNNSSGVDVLPTYSYSQSMMSCQHRLEVTLVGEGLLYSSSTTSWPLYFNIGGPYTDTIVPRQRTRRKSSKNSKHAASGRSQRRMSMPNTPSHYQYEPTKKPPKQARRQPRRLSMPSTCSSGSDDSLPSSPKDAVSNKLPKQCRRQRRMSMPNTTSYYEDRPIKKAPKQSSNRRQPRRLSMPSTWTSDSDDSLPTSSRDAMTNKASSKQSRRQRRMSMPNTWISSFTTASTDGLPTSSQDKLAEKAPKRGRLQRRLSLPSSWMGSSRTSKSPSAKQKAEKLTEKTPKEVGDRKQRRMSLSNAWITAGSRSFPSYTQEKEEVPGKSLKEATSRRQRRLSMPSTWMGISSSATEKKPSRRTQSSERNGGRNGKDTAREGKQQHRRTRSASLEGSGRDACQKLTYYGERAEL